MQYAALILCISPCTSPWTAGTMTERLMHVDTLRATMLFKYSLTASLEDSKGQGAVCLRWQLFLQPPGTCPGRRTPLPCARHLASVPPACTPTHLKQQCFCRLRKRQRLNQHFLKSSSALALTLTLLVFDITAHAIC
jgi:hypothetical protein